MATPHAAQIPLFWGHGTSDPLVLHKFGAESVEFLTSKIGFIKTKDSTKGLDFRSYPGMVHSSCQEELTDMAAWIKRVVPSSE